MTVENPFSLWHLYVALGLVIVIILAVTISKILVYIK